MSRISKALNKTEQPGKILSMFKVCDKEPNIDDLVDLRGKKIRYLAQLAQAINALSATKTISLGTDEEFQKAFGSPKQQFPQIKKYLVRFGVPNPKIIQINGEVKVWGK